MNKKDIYEHLANIYLDASAKKKNKKAQKYPEIFQNLFFMSLIIIFVLIVLVFSISRNNELLFTNFNENKPIKSELALVIQPNIVKINFNFDSAKEEVYQIDLNRLDVTHFKELGFSVRKANYEDHIILRVELINAAKERSEIYFYNLPSYKWQDYKIKFSEFKNINGWAKMSSLSFVIDAWNVKEKKGIVYIDNVRFLR